MFSNKKTSIEDLNTDLGNQIMQDLLASGWSIKNEYDPSMIDKGIDFDAYTLSKNSEVLNFEWNNWFEWKIFGSNESISMIEGKLNL